MTWMFPKIRGTPKWMAYFMENPMNKWMIWGVFPYFWVDTHMYFCSCYAAIQSSIHPTQSHGGETTCGKSLSYAESWVLTLRLSLQASTFSFGTRHVDRSMTTIMASRNALVVFSWACFFRFSFLVDICRWYIIVRYDEHLGEVVSNLL